MRLSSFSHVDNEIIDNCSPSRYLCRKHLRSPILSAVGFEYDLSYHTILSAVGFEYDLSYRHILLEKRLPR
jgi:hypothetical protein